MGYLEKLFHMLSIGILILDKGGRIFFSNKTSQDFLDLYGKNLRDTSPQKALLKKVEQTNIERVFLDKNEYVITSMVLDHRDENMIYAVTIYNSKDIGRLVSNTNLDECKSILDSTQNAIFIDDMHGNTLWINKACEQLYKIKKEEIIGENIDFLEKTGIFTPSVSKLVFKKKQQVTILHSNKHGKKLLTTGTPIFNERGDIEKVISTSNDVTELMTLKNQLEDIQSELDALKGQQAENLGSLVINSQKMKDLIHLAKRLAEIDSTILITGESGVGKGEIAKYIHRLGQRQNKPFVKVNCGAIPESLIESELFGYEHGAFTGSKKQGKLGLFELAQEGTIFLDEIGELPLNLQVKILQVIQDKEILRVGGLKSISVDVRIIAATNKDLRKMVREKQFREDLFYRLNVVPLHILPLSERQEDIFPLIKHFLDKYNEKFNENKRIDPAAMDALIKYPWPGNVRELENIIERIVITTRDHTIYPSNLPSYILSSSDDSSDIKIPLMMNLKDAIEEVEKQIIEKAVIKHKTTREIAKALGVSQPTIVRKINKYTICDSELNQFDS